MKSLLYFHQSINSFPFLEQMKFSSSIYDAQMQIPVVVSTGHIREHF